jgi:hypothetical protein
VKARERQINASAKAKAVMRERVKPGCGRNVDVQHYLRFAGVFPGCLSLQTTETSKKNAFGKRVNTYSTNLKVCLGGL